jgi:catechol 2,3-dioxygenase
VPSRAALARVLMHFIDQQTPLQGLSDHFVSEAIYLGDPDGLGLEIYRDRPRREWEYNDGELNIGTVAMDVRGVLNEHLSGAAPAWHGMEPGTQVGHMHMHVDDVPKAEQFYRGVLGFELITRFAHFASFLAAGGYHHHIAVREGTGPALSDALGLRWYTIVLPDAAAREGVAARLAAAGVTPRETADGPIYADTANNGFRLAVAP